MLTFASNEMLRALYVILLALFNDATVVLAAYDHARPSPRPQRPTLSFLLLMSGCMGVLLAGQSLLFYAYAERFLSPAYRLSGHGGDYRQTMLYAQIGLAITLLVLAARNDRAFFLPPLPRGVFLCSTLCGMVVITLLCGLGGGVVPPVSWRDLGRVWLYDLAGLVVLDALKLAIVRVGPDPASSATTPPQQQQVLELPSSVERLSSSPSAGLATTETGGAKQQQQEVEEKQKQQQQRQTSPTAAPSPSSSSSWLMRRVSSGGLPPRRTGLLQSACPADQIASQTPPLPLQCHYEAQ